MSDDCKGCGHPRDWHYKARDPDYESLDSVYCDSPLCLCWERFAIARQNKEGMTLERKPPRPKSLSQRMAEKGFTRRPSWRALPKDE